MTTTILVGLDFGTTTSHAMVASARAVSNCVTGRRGWGEIRVLFRSDPVFTPMTHERIDEDGLCVLLEEWLAHIPKGSDEITGGAIVTGLAARKVNAARICALVRERIGESVFAVAEDPVLESWVSFMGSCLALSCAYPDSSFLHLDIGGGTTNLALGRNGEVIGTGCVFAGARHFASPRNMETGRSISASKQARTLMANITDRYFCVVPARCAPAPTGSLHR